MICNSREPVEPDALAVTTAGILWSWAPIAERGRRAIISGCPAGSRPDEELAADGSSRSSSSHRQRQYDDDERRRA
jgi:hypothetical protein